MRCGHFEILPRAHADLAATNMPFLPLVSHTSPDSIIARRAEGDVSLRQFLADIRQLVAVLPAGQHLLNMCGDRYQFSVGLAAAIVAGKISLLPSSHTPEVIRQIKTLAPDVYCLSDSEQCKIDLPQVRYPIMARQSEADAISIPQIDTAQCIAVVFTSGSTGMPQPHPKTWGALVRSVQAEASRLDLPRDTSCTLLGTVPPQHMYGFESTVLMAWHSGNALSHAHPFYPADICAALAALPTPRVLISSPVHLRALLDADLALPELGLLISATAPLSTQLAHAIEKRCHAPLLEIYGSTETGLIATRRPTRDAKWRLLPGVRLRAQGECMQACGGHVEKPTPLNDQIELLSDEYFLLHGRMADLVNIAGKRHSLASLNHALHSIPGVIDGAFYMPEESTPGHVTRLAACVVAPGLDAPRLLTALRELIDPVFLPRPLLFVEALPRNSTGKLPQATLQALFDTYSAQLSA